MRETVNQDIGKRFWKHTLYEMHSAKRGEQSGAAVCTSILHKQVANIGNLHLTQPKVSTWIDK